ncbi:hypothetical protein HDU67_008178, partial [Dinochytrium kinnereticum]
MSVSMPSLSQSQLKSVSWGRPDGVDGGAGRKRKGLEEDEEDEDTTTMSISPQTPATPSHHIRAKRTTTASHDTLLPHHLKYVTGSLHPSTVVQRPSGPTESFPSTLASPWCIPSYTVPRAEVPPAADGAGVGYSVPPPSPDVGGGGRAVLAVHLTRDEDVVM